MDDPPWLVSLIREMFQNVAPAPGPQAEIQFIGSFHPVLHEVSPICGLQGIRIIRHTPRPLGKYCRFLHVNALAKTSLARGHGLAVRIPFHLVSLYRCRDGVYLYYDSANFRYHRNLIKFMIKNKIPKNDVKIVTLAKQGQYTGTCAYHALTFLDIVSSCNLDSFEDILWYYNMRIGHFPDTTAVQNVLAMVSELPGKPLSLKVKDKKKSVLGWSIILSSNEEMESRKRRREERRR